MALEEHGGALTAGRARGDDREALVLVLEPVRRPRQQPRPRGPEGVPHLKVQREVIRLAGLGFRGSRQEPRPRGPEGVPHLFYYQDFGFRISGFGIRDSGEGVLVPRQEPRPRAPEGVPHRPRRARI